MEQDGDAGPCCRLQISDFLILGMEVPGRVSIEPSLAITEGTTIAAGPGSAPGRLSATVGINALVVSDVTAHATTACVPDHLILNEQHSRRTDREQ
jgi:hypothetical protein